MGWPMRHHVWEQLGEFAAAVVDYTRALAIEPTNAYAYYNRGISHDRRYSE